MKKKVLILNGQYIPGYKGGGPIQSCLNMVENLAEKFEFLVLTADRDYKSDKPYENIKINQWNCVGQAKVFYMSPEMQTLGGFRKLLNETEFDSIYLNGFFSPIFTIKPLILRRLGRLRKVNIILTPRGDFTGGCENKKIKKYTYILLCRLIGLYRNVRWHATSKLEEKDIKKRFPKADVFVVPNLPAKFEVREPAIHKRTGELRLVFVSRIFPKKNIKFALEVLKKVKIGNVIFDIYGPMEDKAYWQECENIIKELPENVKVSYKGEVSHSEVPHIFEKYHAFFFPTLGENYGHVIVEAMMNNCLMILSKGVTPWDDCDGNGGFIESLSNKDGFRDIIGRLVDIDDKEFRELTCKNREYVLRKINCQEDIKNYYIHLQSK
ncbi:glycosyltransferase family 4 protein [Clostridium manihotivorum]|uniref:Glycosyl transferase family 1 n=1 Tax=Clostridium manihotivorum TaxID=2320868 RepID=A0A3R5X4U2_9CLOT|nr:glycosyltransferase [Clostridium manihotivorum]QAA34736.1 glycosyl transferase family 1 [Clostridium manihotivorum]